MTEQERAAHDAAKHERAAKAAEKQLDAVLGWLERAHPEVLDELIEACRGVLARRQAPEAAAPGLIRRRTRNGEHVVTLRQLSDEEASGEHFAYVATDCEPYCADIIPETYGAWFTSRFRYYIDREDQLDLTEPA